MQIYFFTKFEGGDRRIGDDEYHTFFFFKTSFYLVTNSLAKMCVHTNTTVVVYEGWWMDLFLNIDDLNCEHGQQGCLQSLQRERERERDIHHTHNHTHTHTEK